MQQNHCDGVLSNDWNILLGQQISQHTAMSMSRSALELCVLAAQIIGNFFLSQKRALNNLIEKFSKIIT